MKINSIKNNYNMSPGSFVGEKNRKPVYKKYYELNDTELAARSINKALKTAENSGKMHLLNALPLITTSITAISLGISQPGKLSNKINMGLGFLALASGIDLLTDNFNKISQNKKLDSETRKNTALKSLCALAIATMSATGLFKKNNSINKFIKKEGAQFASEINATKLAKFTDAKLTPFFKKHKILEFALGFIAPTVIMYKTKTIQNKLKQNIDNDFKQNVALNFAKGKEIQKIARAHFDSIDAQEIK